MSFNRNIKKDSFPMNTNALVNDLFISPILGLECPFTHNLKILTSP